MSDSRYIAEVWGGCLGPALPDGTRLWVDPTKEIRPLELCTLVLRDGKGPWDRFMREAWSEAMGDADFQNTMAKIFLRHGTVNGRETFMLGQLYPPCVAVVAGDEVEAMHAVVGSAGHGNIDLVGETEREAFELIAWCAGHASPPINPNWRPDLQKEAAR